VAGTVVRGTVVRGTVGGGTVVRGTVVGEIVVGEAVVGATVLDEVLDGVLDDVDVVDGTVVLVHVEVADDDGVTSGAVLRVVAHPAISIAVAIMLLRRSRRALRIAHLPGRRPTPVARPTPPGASAARTLPLGPKVTSLRDSCR
jgi:hypothetical protein